MADKISVAGLYTYPLTGGPAEAHSTVQLLPGGIIGDRQYVIYDALKDARSESNRISTLMCPELQAVTISRSSLGKLVLHHATKGVHSYLVPHIKEGTSKPTCEINEFRELSPLYDLGDTAAARAARLTGIPSARLGQRHEDWLHGTSGLPVMQRKIAPLHLISEVTVDWFKRHSGVDHDFRRYRPNIVLTGLDKPKQELELIGRTIQIASNPILITRSTIRCAVTGQDPDLARNVRDIPRHFSLLQETDMLRKSRPVMGVYGVSLTTEVVQLNIGDNVSLPS
ncbi:MAG: hypothetical protein NVS1B7_3970 [Candidatus Saccharimonadales bacterium]